MYLRRLKDLREDHDLLQRDVAKVLKITRQQYSLYETGKRDIPVDLLVMLSDYYNTSVDYLVEKSGVKDPYDK